MAGLDDIIGQQPLVRQLSSFLALFERREAVPQHILLIGEDGMGKATIARAIGHGRIFQEIDAADLQIRGDLNAILTNVQPGQVLLISDLQSLGSIHISPLKSAMSSHELVIRIGQGPSAREHKFEIPAFTLVGTVPRSADCPRLLKKEFSLALTLERYSAPEMRHLVARIANANGISISQEAAGLVVRFARSPGDLAILVGRIAKICPGSVTDDDLVEALSAMGMFSRIGDDNQTASEEVLSLSGQQFEELTANLLRHLGFRTEKTKASGDGGVDVIATLDEPIFGGRYLFQCKRFASHLSIGAPTVRDFFGALRADATAVKGVIITTATFTSEAISFAQSVGIELIDGKTLTALLQKFGILAS